MNFLDNNRDAGEAAGEAATAAGAVTTLTAAQLEQLLQAQTNNLEQLFTNQMATLQANLEASMEAKMEAKMQEAERNLKQFMKDSMEDDDDDDGKEQKESELHELRDHIVKMEQSMSQFTSMGMSLDDRTGLQMEGDQQQQQQQQASPTKEMPAPITAGTTTTTSSTGLERILEDTCESLESMVEQRMTQLLEHVEESIQESMRRQRKRSNSMDTSGHQMMRQNQQSFAELLTQKMQALEQFIDNRHAELGAYYSSNSAKLHKLVVETMNAKEALTKEELEAALDARMNEEDDEDEEDEEEGNGDNNGDDAAGQETKEGDEDDGEMEDNEEGEGQGEGEETQEEEPIEEPTLSIISEKMENLLKERFQDLEHILENRSSELEAYTSSANDRLKSDLLELINYNFAQQRRRESAPTPAPAAAPASASAPATAALSPDLQQALEKLIELMTLQASTSDLEEQIQLKLQSIGGGDGEGAVTTASRRNVVTAVTDTSALEERIEKLEALIKSSLVSGREKKTKKSMGLAEKLDEGKETAKAKSSYMDVSVDGTQVSNKMKEVHDTDNDEGDDDDDNKESDDDASNGEQDTSETSGGRNRVKSFMDTLNNWKQINQKQEGVRGGNVSDDDDDNGSNADVSVDSSVDNIDKSKTRGAKAKPSKMEKAVMEGLEMIEVRLGNLEDKVVKLAQRPTAPKLDDIEEMVVNCHETLKSDLQQWIIEQQEESDAALEGNEVSDESNVKRRNSLGAEKSQEEALNKLRLTHINNKLEAIEKAVAQNKTLLEDYQSRAPMAPAASLPRELPMQQNLGQSSAELERKIMSRVENMDKSVQSKLEEIFQEVQSTKSRGDLQDLTVKDQNAIIKAIQDRLRDVEIAITKQLKEQIPDYGMAKSLIAENLEEMRQIVSEVAISEVELLKTQLGVAEEAEQEALHAVVVLREQLEESKQQHHFEAHAHIPPATQAEGYGNFFSFAPSKESAAQGGGPQRFRSRKMSLGQQSNVSTISQHSAGRYGNIPDGKSKSNKSPQEKIEDWRSQFLDLEDKSTDLRTLYGQLRGQDPEEWLDNVQKRNAQMQKTPAKSSLKRNSKFVKGESKEEI